MCFIGCQYEQLYEGKQVCMRPQQCCFMLGGKNCEPILDWVPPVSRDQRSNGKDLVIIRRPDK